MSGPFERERMRHELALRRLTVSAVTTIVPDIVRVTLRGPDLGGFAAPGPADHVKVFLPDSSGVLTVPRFAPDGIRRPDAGEVIARDYTPFAFRGGDDGGELDLDFVLHGDEGPASAWASRARPGDELAVAGPRGSHLPPSGVESAVIVADETALPAAHRWLAALDGIPVTGLFPVADAATSAYLDDDRDLRWLAGSDRYARVEEALRSLPLGEATFVFLAGEAASLVPLRRYLRRELGLRKDQVDAHGYWKRGVVALDHHAPLDPTDPD